VKGVYSGTIASDRGQRLGVDPLLGMPVPGMEAEEAQDAQVILADARLGILDEADAPGGEVGKPSPSGSMTSPVRSA
jgi:hypothetical protein